MSVFDDYDSTTPASNSRKPKTFTQWQDFRRKSPRMFNSVDAQRQMVKDCQALGAEFYDHDPNRKPY
jgi:hypothetical protein